MLAGAICTSDHIAGTLCDGLGARSSACAPGFPIPVGAFDAHWDAIGAGIAEGDVVNVVGTATCIMAIAKQTGLHSRPLRRRARVDPSGITSASRPVSPPSATCSRRSRAAQRHGPSRELSNGLEAYRAGQTGLLHLSWDNGDRTVLVNPNLGGVTLGWNLNHTAQDRSLRGDRGHGVPHARRSSSAWREHGVPIRRVIHAGGIPQKSEVLNQVYANVLGKPVLVPERPITSLGSAIFAFLAAGTFATIEDAQQALCPPYRVIEPDPDQRRVYDRLYPMYRNLYYGFGSAGAEAMQIGRILPELRRIAAEARV